MGLPSLYELSTAMELLEDMLNANEQSADEAAAEAKAAGYKFDREAYVFEQGEIIRQTIEQLQGGEAEKFDSIADYIKSIRALVSGWQAEKRRLEAIIELYDKRADRVETKLREYMKLRGYKQLSTGRFHFSVSGNGGLAPLVFDKTFDTAKVDPSLLKFEPNNTAIRRFLAGGGELVGVRIGERGEHLRF